MRPALIIAVDLGRKATKQLMNVKYIHKTVSFSANKK